LQDNGKGKAVPVKVGMGMEQRSGFEYEFTAVMEGTVDNVFTVTKDRTGLMQGQVYEKPGVDLGRQLKEWLESGAEPRPAEVIPEQPKQLSLAEKINKIAETAKKSGISDIKSFATMAGIATGQPERESIIDMIISDADLLKHIIDKFKGEQNGQS